MPVFYPIFTCVDLDPNSEYGSGYTKVLKTYPIWIRIHHTGQIIYEHDKKKIYHMHGNNPYVFGCWADLVVHLLLPKNSIPWVKARRDSVVENQTKVGQKTFPWLGAARISTIEWLQTTPSSLLDRCSAYSIYLLLLVGLPKVAINFDFV